ncbi:MAG TPA: transporter [Planctomycetaceae bacterium]|nr:transporter [Planctomycetaceae bacterium]
MHKFVALCSVFAIAGCASKPASLSTLSNTADVARPSATETAAVNDATIASLEAATIELAGAAVAQSNKTFVRQAESVEIKKLELVAVAKSADDSNPTVKPEPVMRPEPIADPNVGGSAGGKVTDKDNSKKPADAKPAKKPELPESSIAESATDRDGSTIDLDAVIDSVYRSYPLLEAAVQQRTIAFGEQMQALGEFDLKVTAASENQPTGFYETYRQRAGFVQPRYEGGNFFGGYRVGRGNFEPWYKERETNEAGEFRAGLAVPLARDRRIDERRAALWRANTGRQLADPDINAQLIGFVQEAGYAYWNWVAAGEKYRIAEGILQLAEERTEGIRRQAEQGLLDPPVLTDNLRLIADRKAAVAAAQQKLRLSAVKLSLYLRGPDNRPLIPEDSMLPKFPPPIAIELESMPSDISVAINQRPEIAVLAFMRQQLEIDFAQASNEFQPSIDAVLGASQDVGRRASSSNDKGEFEADASVYLDVPVQRRKARGKMQATQGKITQVSAKLRLTEDKVVADVQAVYAAMIAAYEQVEQMRQSVEFAEDLARRERRNLELGASDLLIVALREQFAVEAAAKLVDALLIYYLAQADYRAALAEDQLP